MNKNCVVKNTRQNLHNSQNDIDVLIRKVIGACYTVHNALGTGFLESVYENSLKIELDKLDIRAKKQHEIQVYYDKYVVGEFRADLFIEDCLLIELKAVKSLVPVHEVQLVNYLAATQIDDGLLINFGQSVEVKRKYRKYTSTKNSFKQNSQDKEKIGNNSVNYVNSVEYPASLEDGE